MGGERKLEERVLVFVSAFLFYFILFSISIFDSQRDTEGDKKVFLAMYSFAWQLPRQLLLDSQ